MKQAGLGLKRLARGYERPHLGLLDLHQERHLRTAEGGQYEPAAGLSAQERRDFGQLIRFLRDELGKTVLYIVPAPQAVLALRAKIVAGQAPGLKMQSDLFTDATGHGTPALKTLVGYCNYAVIYRRRSDDG